MRTKPCHPAPRAAQAQGAPRGWRSCAALALALGLSGCGADERGPYPVEPGRERAQADRAVPPGATAFGRLPAVDAQGRPALAWKLPEGWIAQPPGSMRVLSAGIAEVAGGPVVADVSISWAGGSPLDNVNRWRRQFGQPALDEVGLSGLRRMSLAGNSAVLVEASGTFASGMSDAPPRPGHGLLGLASLAPGGERLFVKLVGPEALVTAQRAAFEAFAASIQRAGSTPAPPSAPPPAPSEPAAATPAGAPQPPPAAAPAAPGFDPARLVWTLPAGWQAERSKRPMRLFDVKVEGAAHVEGVLLNLSGNGGGEALNVNRWRGQMGQPALGEAEIAALERIEMLGVKAVWVEIEGRYQGMNAEDVPDALFIGVVCLLEKDALFFRLVGPKAEVAPLREPLRALLASLKVGP